MLRQNLTKMLEMVTEDVPKHYNELFETIEIEMEAEVDEERENSSGNKHGECEEGSRSNGGSCCEDEGAEGVTNGDAAKAKYTKVTTKTKSTRKEYRKVLTHQGKRFMNAMLDHASLDRVGAQIMNGIDTLDKVSYPNLKFVRMIDVSQNVYYNSTAEVLRYNDDEAKLVAYPEYQLDKIDWCVDEEGEVVEAMNPDEFARTWSAIFELKANNTILKKTSVNKKLSKQSKTMNEFKVAYLNGKLMHKIGDTPTEDDLMLAYLTKPEWKLVPKQFLMECREFNVTPLQAQLWMCSQLSGSRGNTNNKGNVNNARRDQIRKANANKNNKSSQPENDAKAVAHNPNHQGEE